MANFCGGAFLGLLADLRVLFLAAEAGLRFSDGLRLCFLGEAAGFFGPEVLLITNSNIGVGIKKTDHSIRLECIDVLNHSKRWD
ncbi:hypothetical protein [Bacterioplanoides sp.]|uniref:hypothetical protein n=1 Tax=Bacterioplanoides sp. TaxID=2066072 RepID=UPI003B00FC9C